MCKKVISIIILISCNMMPVHPMEFKKSTYVSDAVKICSGFFGGALLAYLTLVKPKDKKIKELKGIKKFYKDMWGITYFNSSEQNLNECLQKYGLEEKYIAKEAKLKLDNRNTDLLVVIAEKK